MTTITHPIESGALIRVAEHDLVTVEEYVSGEEAEDGRPYYLCSTPNGFNNFDAFTGDVTEIVMSAEQMRNRKPPTPEALAKVIDMFNEPRDCAFRIDETEVEGDKVEPWGPTYSINVFGKTEEGLRFAAVVSVSRVQEVDF